MRFHDISTCSEPACWTCWMYSSALTVKPKWLALILCGEKRWEIRQTNTAARGRIALLASGSSLIYGSDAWIKLSKLEKTWRLEIYDEIWHYEIDNFNFYRSYYIYNILGVSKNDVGMDAPTIPFFVNDDQPIRWYMMTHDDTWW